RPYFSTMLLPIRLRRVNSHHKKKSRSKSSKVVFLRLFLYWRLAPNEHGTEPRATSEKLARGEARVSVASKSGFPTGDKMPSVRCRAHRRCQQQRECTNEGVKTGYSRFVAFITIIEEPN